MSLDQSRAAYQALLEWAAAHAPELDGNPAMPTMAVCIIEYTDAEGVHFLTGQTDPEAPSWRAMGLLHFALYKMELEDREED